MKLTYCLITVLLILTSMPNDTGETASIEGFTSLNDATRLAEVSIGAHPLGTDSYVETKTDLSGYYVLPNLPAGAYEMWAYAKGFGCIIIPRVAVHYGQRVRQDFNFHRKSPLGSCEAIEKTKPTKTNLKVKR